VATKVSQVGEVLEQPVFRILTSQVIPLFPVDRDYGPAADQESLDLILDIASSGDLYYSPTYNLTKALQRQVLDGSYGKPLAPSLLDDRFYWNHALAEVLTGKKAGHFVTPVIYGHFSHKHLPFNGEFVNFVLVSRRHRKRAGLRYTKRGSDFQGHTANYVETEQIVLSPTGKVSAFVQTRGSIPILWKQTVDMKYKPRLVIHAAVEENAKVMRIHLEEQIAIYGNQTLVSLISRVGFERTLRDSFADAVMSLANEKVTFVEFHVNEECKGMKYHNMVRLVENVRQGVTRDGVFVWESKAPAEVVQNVVTQQGSLRTNCLDCLDRTNLAQSFVALDILPRQLAHIGMISTERLGDNQTTLFSHEFLLNFRNIWADNGDRISVQYAGTGALKGDFTRTAKRRLRGDLADGVNAISRYYHNNFMDGKKQDGLDLFLGRRKVSVIEEKGKRHEPLLQSQLWYVTLVVGFVRMFAPRQIGSNLQFLQAVFWSLFMVMMWTVLNLDGRVLTVHPTIPDEVDIPIASQKPRCPKKIV